MKKRLTKSFFTNQTTLQLAKNLLGCVLVHETPAGRIAGYIYETEAYTETDEASHSYGGRKTRKNETMFREGGHLYVYFTYGMHHCANIVAGREGKGNAVLIRSVFLTEGINHARHNRKNNTPTKDTALTDGPAKICQAFTITAENNGIDLTDPRGKIYIQKGEKLSQKIQRTPRIGISKGKDKKWRFVIPH